MTHQKKAKVLVDINIEELVQFYSTTETNEVFLFGIIGGCKLLSCSFCPFSCHFMDLIRDPYLICDQQDSILIVDSDILLHRQIEMKL